MHFSEHFIERIRILRWIKGKWLDIRIWTTVPTGVWRTLKSSCPRREISGFRGGWHYWEFRACRSRAFFIYRGHTGKTVMHKSLNRYKRQEVTKPRVNEILNLQIRSLYNDYQKNLDHGNFGVSERSKMRNHLRSKMKNIHKYSLNRLRKEQEQKRRDEPMKKAFWW